MRMIVALLATCALCTGAQAETKKKEKPPDAQKPQRYDFDDDKVEGDVQRGDDPIVESRNRARFGSLIKPRSNFIPELLRSGDQI
jgi:hypothetical protein